MHVKELVGKRAIRTTPVRLGMISDYSYTADPILVLVVTEDHIVFEHTTIIKGKQSILDSRWLDDNWTDYDALMALADKAKRIESIPVDPSWIKYGIRVGGF